VDRPSAATPDATRAADVLRTAHVRHDDPAAFDKIAATIGADDLELVILFVSPEADFAGVISRAAECCGPTRVIGCTTAGEISPEGYSEGEIVAVGLPRALFRARTMLIDDLTDFDAQAIIDQMIRTRHALAEEEPDWGHEFNFVMIDGLSTHEDALTSQIAPGLGPVPLFGGSAGDGTRFGATFVLHDGRALSNAAVLTQVRTRCPIKVFKTDHLTPTEQRMVVTGADPERRIVHEINAEPAAREYARILGKDPESLTTFTFAAHPVAVRIGGQHHVRAIQRVAENGDLVFFSAIDEGLVLTLAEPQNMVTHLERELAALAAGGAPAGILACDCILRRMEAQQKQMSGAISDILKKNRVVGFSTYGEQLNSMHVNQTLTGVAIYPPAPEPEVTP
jgi:hypothetical protein